MNALIRMRLAAFLRGGWALAPLIAALVTLGVLYGGGAAPAAEAYGVSAVVLFPVLAWQSKLLLDAEPDVQRRIARVSVGAPREVAAGAIAAAVLALGSCVIAMILPWLTGGIRRPGTGEPSLATWIGLGGWAHLLAVPAGVALGALASRAVTRSVLTGVVVLVTGSVVAIVFGLRGSVAPWLAPPVMPVARVVHAAPTPGQVLLLTLHAALWSAVSLAGYAWLRRRRA